MDKLKFGDFIYKRRKMLGLSQEILGHKLGVTNKAVSKWETGETLPDVQLMEHLANVLNVTMDELYTQTDSVKEENTKSNIFITITIILSIIIIVLSSILISDHFKDESNSNNDDSDISLSLSNYTDYLSITPCNKTEIDNQTLVMYGIININEDINVFNEVKITFEYNLHLYYKTIDDNDSLYVFLNHQTSIDISTNTTFFEISFIPTLTSFIVDEMASVFLDISPKISLTLSASFSTERSSFV